MQTAKCNHQSCNCSGDDVRSDGYCSDACKNGNAAGDCACGHPSCSK